MFPELVQINQYAARWADLAVSERPNKELGWPVWALNSKTGGIETLLFEVRANLAIGWIDVATLN